MALGDKETAAEPPDFDSESEEEVRAPAASANNRADEAKRRLDARRQLEDYMDKKRLRQQIYDYLEDDEGQREA